MTRIGHNKSIPNFRRLIALCIRVLFVALVLLVLLFVFQLVKNPGQPPSIFGYQPFTVLSNSMNPSFEAGDLVIVKSVEVTDINVNDVITFSDTTDKYVTHRVIEIINDNGNLNFVTKGDNNNVRDENLVFPESIVGKKVFMIANAGFIAKFVSGPIGFILLILLPLTGYICLELYERMRKSSNTRKAIEQNE